MSQKEDMRLLYIECILENKFPLVPVYYYYATKVNSVHSLLNINDFEHYIHIVLKPSLDKFGKEISPAMLDVKMLRNILSDYYQVFHLYDVEGNLIFVY